MSKAPQMTRTLLNPAILRMKARRFREEALDMPAGDARLMREITADDYEALAAVLEAEWTVGQAVAFGND
jgi:hypothetical protein